MFETEIKMCLRCRWNSGKTGWGGLEGGREERGGWWLQKQRRGKPQQKDLIRETVWKRQIEVEMILKRWRWGGNALKTERRVIFGGEGAQWWCQYEAVNTGPRLILQLSVVIKWERSRKPPSIQTLSLLLCQDQRMEHYCICNTAQLLKPSPSFPLLRMLALFLFCLISGSADVQQGDKSTFYW